MTDIIANLLSLVPAVIPSLSFVLAVMMVFDPILQTSVLFTQPIGVKSLIDLGFLVIIPVTIQSYTLTVLNTYILKLQSGVVVFEQFPTLYNSMCRRHILKAQKLLFERESLGKRIEALEKQSSQRTKEEDILKKLRRRHDSISAEYDSYYPPSLDDILPTKFGNILKAAEAYTGTQYGIDDIAFWPLLTAVIPPEYQKTVANARNELAFMVNMSVLSVAFYMMCLLAIIYTSTTFPFGIMGKTMYFMIFDSTFRYLVAGMAALSVNWFFNKAAIYPARSYGLAIRFLIQNKRSRSTARVGKKRGGNTIHIHVGGDVGGNLVVGDENDINKPSEHP
jgi:hypothetical protein